MQEPKLTIYADLNCPFCYALHEHLMNACLLAEVEWRAIEHMPSAKFNPDDSQVHSKLIKEITEARELAPNTTLNVPASRPNTRRATEVLTEISGNSPIIGDFFRTLLYRTLWVEGRDISDPMVLAEIMQKAGFNQSIISEKALQTMQLWQDDWETGDFSRYIPALLTNEGSKLLGLPSAHLLTNFLEGNNIEHLLDNAAICRLSPKENILVASNNYDLSSSIAKSTRAEYDLSFTKTGKETIEIATSNNQPDIILIDADLSDPDGISTCREIRENITSSHIPTIILSDNIDTDSEIKAFNVGASDFVGKDISPDILNARTRTLLRLKRAFDLLKEVAQIDYLTEIPNRREFNRAIELAWRKGMRSEKELSVILIDIDHFKNYNDNYGHIEGDKCLRRVARLLQGSVKRPSDTVARYGGEEFILVLPNTSCEGALIIAEQIRLNLKQANIPHAHSPTAEYITVSLGVAGMVPTASANLSDLIESADNALYAAKEAGRNQVAQDSNK